MSGEDTTDDSAPDAQSEDNSTYEAVKQEIESLTLPEPDNDTDASTDNDDTEDQASDGEPSDTQSDEDDGADEQDDSSDDGAQEDGGGDDDEPADGEEGDGDETDGDDDADEPDHVNDPIPDTLNKSTQTRIRGLIDNVKTVSSERDAAVAESQQVFSAIEETGASPEQYAATLGVLKMFNSDDPKLNREALTVLTNMSRDLSLRIGEGAQYVDLKDYPDLSADVEAGELSEQRAKEIAASRLQATHAETRRNERAAATSDAERTQQLIEQGKQELNAFGESLKADPRYAQIYPQFTSILSTTLREVHPTKWREVAERTYQQLKDTTPLSSPPSGDRTSGGKGGKQRPMRAKSGSSSSGKQSDASSPLDAMAAAIGEING